MRDNSKFKKFVKIFWYLFFGGIISIILFLLLIAIGSFGKMPDYKQLENPKFDLASEIYSADGEIIGKYYVSNRTFAQYHDISPNLVKALIATEDIRFYEHSGIDPRGTARAIVFLGKKGGASTITQQLAKMLYHEVNSNIIIRIKQKLQEWIIAAQLERRYTKEEIIAMYFSKFDYTHNAVGIHSAADVYFNTSPGLLKIEQAALLVAMVNNPVLYNPLRRPDTCLFRRNLVLAQMEKYGFLDPGKLDSLIQLPLGVDYKLVSHYTGSATYFRQVLKNEVLKILNEKHPSSGEYLIKKPDGTKYNLYTDGLKIYTTIDSRMQKYAEEAVIKYLGKNLQNHFFNDIKNRNHPPFDNNLSNNQVDGILWSAIRQSSRYRRMKENNKKITDREVWNAFKKKTRMTVFSCQGEKDTTMSPLDSIKYYKSILQAGMMSMVPQNGHVKAWVGGVDNKHFQYDHVIQAKRQVGSTFKPILYATALEDDKFEPCEQVANIPYYINEGELGLLERWEPAYGPKFEGMVSYKYALANSMNNVAVHLMKKVKPGPVVKKAKAMGISSPLAEVASICLGVSDVSLFEMVGAYGCFANQGIWRQPIFLTRIEDRNGNVLVKFESASREALDEHTAATMLEMMKGTVDGVYNKYRGKTSSTAHSLRTIYKFDYPIAGKTGTTQNNTDGWFMGITPVLITGVWVGAGDPSVHFRSSYFGQGAVMALPIWALYMNEVYNDKEIQFYKGDFNFSDSLVINMDCQPSENELDAEDMYLDDPNLE